VPPSLLPPRGSPDTSPHRLSVVSGWKMNRIAGAGAPAHSATPCREFPAIHLAGLSPGVHENARSTLDCGGSTPPLPYPKQNCLNSTTAKTPRDGRSGSGHCYTTVNGCHLAYNTYFRKELGQIKRLAFCLLSRFAVILLAGLFPGPHVEPWED